MGSQRSITPSLHYSVRFFVCVLALAVAGSVLNAQPDKMAARSVVKGFTVPEYFDPPHETQIKSLLEGAEARPEPGGLIFITDLKMQTFNEQGERQMVVNAPECIYDSSQRTVGSSGKLQVQMADEKLLLAGEGFLWQQTNSNLIISNRVSTIIRGPLNNSFVP